MSFSIRNYKQFSFSDLTSNALYLQPLAAGWKSGSTTAGNALNTVVLNASGNSIPSASTQSNAFFVAPIRKSTTNACQLYYNPTTKEIVCTESSPPPVSVYRAVAVGTTNESNVNTVIYSDDGINWTSSSSGSAGLDEGQGAGWDGSQWIIGGYPPSYTGMYSSDGENYTGASTLSSILTASVNCVTSNGSRWVAGGTNGNSESIAYSDDGINWTPVGASAYDKLSLVLGVAYSSDLTRFVAVGVYNSSGSNECIIYSDDDGVTWNYADTVVIDTTGRCVAWNGTYWLAGGDGPDLLVKSTDGINWTNIDVSSLISDFIFGIAWNGERWVAGGYSSSNDNCIIYSTDGENWTNSVSGKNVFMSQPTVNGVAWNGERWIAVGSGYNASEDRYITVVYSTDGINDWTEAITGSSLITFTANGVHSALVPLFNPGV